MEGGFEAWPALDELFPVKFQGVNHNRGVEGGVIDANATTLRERMKKYFTAKSFAEAAKACPEIAAPKARYQPEKVWKALKKAPCVREVAARIGSEPQGATDD
jgi:hypothetical protein